MMALIHWKCQAFGCLSSLRHLEIVNLIWGAAIFFTGCSNPLCCGDFDNQG